MTGLRKRFGRLLAAYRRRRGLTQEALAEAAAASPDTVAKIEVGATGARFPVIERLATALDIDPAELFTMEISAGPVKRGTFAEISITLAQLSESDLVWVRDLLRAALTRRGTEDRTQKISASPNQTVGTRRRSSALAKQIGK